MRVFMLGMWLAIAMIATGPAVRSLADEPATDGTAKVADAEEKESSQREQADKDKAASDKAEKEKSEKEKSEKADDEADAKASEEKKEEKQSTEKAKERADEEKAAAEKKKSEAAKKSSDAKEADGAADKAKPAKDEAKAEAKKVRLASIVIEGELPESPGEMTLFGDLGADLRKTIARLEKAAEDEKIAGIVLHIDSEIGRGKLNELRDAVKRVQSKGKKVYAVLESAFGSQYLLASACDEIVLPESGDIMLPGVRAEFAFYKDLLGKLGIEADMMHVGDYKGAAEPYTRDSLSEPVRENMTALVEDLYDETLSTVARDRDLRIDDVKKAVNRGLLLAEEAKEAGLIDRVSYPDEFRSVLAKEYKADELVYVENYAKKKVDADFSGPMGMMKLLQTMMGESDKKSDGSDRKIAVIYAVGAIMTGESQSGVLSGSVMGSKTIVEALREADKDDRVKAIVLRVDSPGGSALASDLIWRQTQAIEKPIVASMGDVAASGGYYISMGADRIFAEPGTITGSIGVVGGKLSMKGLYDKIGMKTEAIARGENSGMFSSTAKFTDSERQVIEKLMKDVYEQFTAKAAKGRGMERDALEKLAGGQVYTGRVAKRIGLVDEVGTLRDAIQSAKRLAGIDPDEKVEIKVLPEPQNPFEALFGAEMDAEKEVESRLLTGLLAFAPELRGAVRHALTAREVMHEQVAVMLPYWFEIK
ncbi:MAG: signal peptide peptidase SppA [Planctomycetota bacterium]|nr:MAG: signal peptide peptidase SppA [Planctomycetota bacterium]